MRDKAGMNFSSEYQVSFFLVVIFLLVIVTGVFSYIKLNNIIDTINHGTRPDRKLFLFKEVFNDLTEAENDVKSFSLTRSPEYMFGFYQLTESTGYKVDELKDLAAEDQSLVVYFDTLDFLVEKKFTILNRLLVIQDEFRVGQAMEKVMESIREREVKPEMVPVDTAKPVVVQKKENFFSRLFKKNRRNKEETADTVKVTPLTAPDTVDWVEEVSAQVRVVQKQASSREKALLDEEWQLLQQDRQTMEQIRKLLIMLEERESSNLKAQALKAENNAYETKMIIVSFVVSASLFLIFAALIIFRYIRRNNEYRITLDRARRDAEDLASAKERFLANMSHEIRTPMNIISGFLAQVLSEKLEDTQREKLSVVKKSSDHLIHLLNDLLDLSRLEADKLALNLADFQPADIIADLVQSLGPAAAEKHLTLLSRMDPEVPEMVQGDPGRLRQILLNLVGNAIKFSDSGKIELDVTSVEKSEFRAVLIFKVTDTGIGIDASEQDRIFTEFEQGSGTLKRNAEGAGLGLSITRKLVELQGGKITLVSRPGEGSAFSVEIPYTIPLKKSDKDLTQSSHLQNNLNGIHVLVVEDDEYNRRLMNLILQKYGCHVDLAGTAEEAITLAERQEFDIVLMDIRLPGMKGTEASGELTRIMSRKGKKTPIIIVSAAISREDMEDIKGKGIIGILSKPFEESELLSAIGTALPSPAYDLAPLKETSQENVEFFREMVKLFLQETGTGLSQLKSFLEEKEWELAAEVAHKISSPCRHLKAMVLYGKLKELEEQLTFQGRPGKAGELLKEAIREFDGIRDDIQRKYNLSN